MKKIVMGLALMSSMIVTASVDVYSFTSTMNVYSIQKHKYVSTKFNGTMTVDTDDGSILLSGVKKDTGEAFELEMSSGATPAITTVTTNYSETVETLTTVEIDTVLGTTNTVVETVTNKIPVVVTNTTPAVVGDSFSIISGKKNQVGASYLTTFSDDEELLALSLAGDGTAKTITTGCGPCGDKFSCTKIKTYKGSYIGTYNCGCGNGQHYLYDGACELPEEKETSVCPVWGTWKAHLKTVDGAKYK